MKATTSPPAPVFGTPIRIVVIADIVMSLDNVIAVAAAANGQLPLLILGLAISIPMIIAGAALIMMVLDRFPILVWLGAILLGWIAGDVIATDPAVHPFLQRLLDGQIALNLDATSAMFGVSPHFSLDGDTRRIYLLGARRDRGTGGGIDLAEAQAAPCRTSRAPAPPRRPGRSSRR